jgi:CPA2 family monovalent cation:H+ antiporter-2
MLWGFLVALSSTAIVLKLLGERGETDSPHGRIVVGVLILQDLSVVSMMFLLPLLAGTAARSEASLGWVIATAVSGGGGRPRQCQDNYPPIAASGGTHSEP